MGENSITHTHPAVQHVLMFFKYGHLPERLQEISKPFGDLEAKDAAVRAAL